MPFTKFEARTSASKAAICHENLSVLNTDTFDRRRFKEILDMSQQLRKLRNEAVLPMFEPLLSDIWASLFKMKPTIIEKVIDEALLVNKTLMSVIMTDEYYTHYRNFTCLNDFASAFSTIKYGEKINHWLASLIEKDSNLQEWIRQVHYSSGMRPKQNDNPKTHAQLMNELNKTLQQTIRQNSESLLKSLDEAQRESKQVNAALKSLLGGISAGSAESQMKKVPLRDQIVLAEKIASTKKMKDIAEWAGRFKQIARTKQKTKRSESVERNGVRTGNNIEVLLPVELSFYTHQLTKMDFLRRFAESQTMQFEQKSPEVLSKGPIILCLDQSDSMSSHEIQSKGFALALMSIAKKQKRDFCLVLFASETKVFEYRKGKMATTEIMRIAQTYLRGGTNFAYALDEAMDMIGKSRFKQADIIFITDGEDQVPDSFMEKFKEKKRKKAFNVLSIVLGRNSYSVEQFSDRLITIKDFDDVECFTAFEL